MYSCTFVNFVLIESEGNSLVLFVFVKTNWTGFIIVS